MFGVFLSLSMDKLLYCRGCEQGVAFKIVALLALRIPQVEFSGSFAVRAAFRRRSAAAAAALYYCSTSEFGACKAEGSVEWVVL